MSFQCVCVCVAESIDCNIMMLQHKKVTVLDKSANEQPQKKADDDPSFYFFISVFSGIGAK